MSSKKILKNAKKIIVCLAICSSVLLLTSCRELECIFGCDGQNMNDSRNDHDGDNHQMSQGGPDGGNHHGGHDNDKDKDQNQKPPQDNFDGGNAPDKDSHRF